MASDYNAIRHENKRRYGTDIGRIGPMLLAQRYADRTHFIFELLQNAEDALARRPLRWRGSRAVTFALRKGALRVSHYGEPFNEADVRGICGIAESTKDYTAIGRFGIGFKSVYAFTDRPEVHSGTEDFAIENFVWPVPVSCVKREPDETSILVPLKVKDEAAHVEIAAGLERLDISTLLFLRNIEEIDWSVDKGRSGIYLRETKRLDGWVRQVDVLGQERGKQDDEGRWLVFSRPVSSRGQQAGNVEIAFSVAQDLGSRRKRAVQRVQRSPLVVFFPTVVETYLGFLVQGPYRTTPSRDNVPRSDVWNQHLVHETASLLVDALTWLRDRSLLDTSALRCLPLEAEKFSEDSMFARVFAATKKALSSELLLPRFDEGHVSAKLARLARTQELRDLCSPSQLKALFGMEHELVWLSGEITQDRTPELRRYLIDELGVDELTPESIVPKLGAAFLKAQSDEWIVTLYEFLDTQPALRHRLTGQPLIRLHDGTHISAVDGAGHAQAFLPSKVQTGFPTVRAAVCSTEGARAFLQSLGLTEPDPVDDVIHNLLPKYQRNNVKVGANEYEADIRRIHTAFATDSKARREKLVAALKETAFVMAVDARDGSKWRLKPDSVYLATERLKELFRGIRKVFLVDDAYACLRGEYTRELLEACGATRNLQPMEVSSSFEWDRRHNMRMAAGCVKVSWGERVEDLTLRGLDAVLESLPQLDPQGRNKKAALLWEALVELHDRRGTSVFSGTYSWYYRRWYSTQFDAAFVRKLNDSEWVPDKRGNLQRPELVLFEELNWKPNPFIESRVPFKPPIIEVLAREAGIEPGAIDLLKKLGLTSEAELRQRLGLPDETHAPSDDFADRHQTVEDEEGDVSKPVPLADSSVSRHVEGSSSGKSTTESSTEAVSREGHASSDARHDRDGAQDAESTHRRSAAQGRSFVSYIAVHIGEQDTDPDGLDHLARMELESKAIDLILLHETCWERTPTHNPGYDLYEPDKHGTAFRWCEVKAMTGSMEDRPVGLSRAQFTHAQEHGESYWLYVVEHAGTSNARILRIQDPAGKASTFTFDRGWVSVAIVEGSAVQHQE